MRIADDEFSLKHGDEAAQNGVAAAGYGARGAAVYDVAGECDEAAGGAGRSDSDRTGRKGACNSAAVGVGDAAHAARTVVIVLAAAGSEPASRAVVTGLDLATC